MNTIDRRGFLGACLALLFSPLALSRAARAAVSAQLATALEQSPFVYVSPLKSNGQESTCHAEVWFAWFDGGAVLITGSDRWKARAVKQGLSGARLWVGDYGRWKGLVSNSEDFRKGPSFEARASIVKDESVLERLIAAYERKYPAEIDRWRDKFRAGYADGSRVLIRYAPV